MDYWTPDNRFALISEIAKGLHERDFLLASGERDNIYLTLHKLATSDSAVLESQRTHIDESFRLATGRRLPTRIKIIRASDE